MKTETLTGALQQNVGFPGTGYINGGTWINPEKEKLMAKAGYFTIKEMQDGK